MDGAGVGNGRAYGEVGRRHAGDRIFYRAHYSREQGREGDSGSAGNAAAPVTQKTPAARNMKPAYGHANRSNTHARKRLRAAAS